METRKRLRLPAYDYTRTGPYFVTICLSDRTPLFGTVDGHEMKPSPHGVIVAAEIRRLETRFTGVTIDLAIVMPDHAHLIVALGVPTRRLGTVVGSLKATSAREINRLRGTTGTQLWQRGYHEHVIRDETDLDRIREYIATNPIRWTLRHGSP